MKIYSEIRNTCRGSKKYEGNYKVGFDKWPKFVRVNNFTVGGLEMASCIILESSQRTYFHKRAVLMGDLR